MRALLVAVVVMGVLIVAGVATLAVTIVQRLSAAPPGEARSLLDEPPGTRMQSIAAAGGELAVLLTGGGADRIVLIDPRTGRASRRIGLPP